MFLDICLQVHVVLFTMELGAKIITFWYMYLNSIRTSYIWGQTSLLNQDDSCQMNWRSTWYSSCCDNHHYLTTYSENTTPLDLQFIEIHTHYLPPACGSNMVIIQSEYLECNESVNLCIFVPSMHTHCRCMCFCPCTCCVCYQESGINNSSNKLYSCVLILPEVDQEYMPHPLFVHVTMILCTQCYCA